MIATRFLWQLYLLIAALLLSIFLLYSYPSPLHQNFYTTICRRPAKQGQFQWSIRKERYPVSSYLTLPTKIPKKLPTIQHEFPEETKEARIERLERREAVKFAFVRSWDGYRTYAWGEDELLPLSGGAKRRFGGWGATLVETLDTLWIMGYKAEFEEAVNEVATIDFTTTEDEEINVFETTVRYLGGLLGAYDVSGGNYPVLLEKAVEVGDFLYAAFDTENRMPVVRWKWKRCVSRSFARRCLTGIQSSRTGRAASWFGCFACRAWSSRS
jgi:mannosyl-oligosaccharide alpha-1,2-mannosidase